MMLGLVWFGKMVVEMHELRQNHDSEPTMALCQVWFGKMVVEIHELRQEP